MSNRQFLKYFSGLIAALIALTAVLFVAASVVGGKAKKPEGSVMEALIPAAYADEVGEKVFKGTCTNCHTMGIAGAPKFGDKSAWASRVAQGKATLYDHAIKGFSGKAGFMPSRGGNASLKDDEVKAAVDYMVSKSQ